MASEISLFSTKSFIDASKNFVCVRLGSYESKEHQTMVRDLLRGSFQNTAFVVYAPDGKTKLTRSGRAPHRALGQDVIPAMDKLAAQFKPRNLDQPAVLQDFHSFKQSLNVASTDQRLLVFSVPSSSSTGNEKTTLSTVFNDKDIAGRFHFDTLGSADATWSSLTEGENNKSGFFIIKPGSYGQTGTVMAELPLNSSAEALKKSLLEANTAFAKSETRKVYKEHVATGKQNGINFENTMPHGEDRDGDGKIDPKGERRNKGERRGPRPRD